MWSWRVFRRFGFLGILIAVAGRLVSFFSGRSVSLADIGTDAPFRFTLQDDMNGIMFAALFLVFLFVLVGCFGILARALFSMAAHTIRSRDPQFFNVRQSEANMLFSFFELDAFGRVRSAKGKGQ